jgi:hypothetical protein
MGSGTVPDAAIGLKSAQCPIQSVMVCRTISRLSAISSYVAHASHSASAYRIAPPAIFPHSRGLSTVFVEECNGSFPPLASAFLGPSANYLFFVHCLGQQQHVLRPGQEAVSAVYCPSARRLEGGRVRTRLPCRTRPGATR